VDAVYLAMPQSEHFSATIAAARWEARALREAVAVTAEQSAEMVRVCDVAACNDDRLQEIFEPRRCT